MAIEREFIKECLKNGDIRPYESSLIEKLRNLYYEGLPLSIVLNSKYCCRTWCHHMAFQLSRGMDDFKLIRGNINIYPIEEEPNHSWVEKNGFVYDTTDGFCWKKEIYDKYFQAVPMEIYDQDSWMNFDFYQKELEKTKTELDDINILLMLEFIELLEIEDPSINYHTLLEEIRIFRENKKLTKRLSKEIVEEYKRMVFQRMDESQKKSKEKEKSKKS